MKKLTKAQNQALYDYCENLYRRKKAKNIIYAMVEAPQLGCKETEELVYGIIIEHRRLTVKQDWLGLEYHALKHTNDGFVDKRFEKTLRAAIDKVKERQSLSDCSIVMLAMLEGKHSVFDISRLTGLSVQATFGACELLRLAHIAYSSNGTHYQFKD